MIPCVFFSICSAGTQVETLNSNIPRKDLVPNAPTSTQVSVTGERDNYTYPNYADRDITTNNYSF